MPSVASHNHRAQHHLVSEFDLEQSIDERLSLSPVERPRGEDQEVEIGMNLSA
jgi:hypothetical protein